MQKIKAVFLDLDDTLFDCTGQLVAAAQNRAAIAMAKAGFPLDSETILKKQHELFQKFGGRINIFDKLCEQAGLDEKKSAELVTIALRAYNSNQLDGIVLFPGTMEMLERLKKNNLKIVILTSGFHERQEKKIELLGLEKIVDLAIVSDAELGESKENSFEIALSKLSLSAKEVVCAGDRIQSEIKIGNSLGMTTVRLLHGRYAGLIPKNELETPDFEIKKITELEQKILEIQNGNCGKKCNGLKVVAIGGGTGLPLVIGSLRQYTKNITAIVTVTDSGRSSGILRKEFGIPAPGDLRNCLLSMAKSEKLLLDLFDYRFEGKIFKDMNFGNLFLVALTKITGSFEKAINAAGNILAIDGKVLPSTLHDINFCTELEDGTIFKCEDDLIQRNISPKKIAKRAPVKKVWLSPSNAKILPEAKKAILEADLIIIGPGSLYTSVIANLLVKGMKEAIKKSSAKKVFIANVMTQVNQTNGFALSDHIVAIEKYLGKNVLDYIVFNNKKPEKKTLARYIFEQSFFVKNDFAVFPEKPVFLSADLAEVPVFSKKKATKQRLLRHDGKKISEILISISNGNL